MQRDFLNIGITYTEKITNYVKWIQHPIIPCIVTVLYYKSDSPFVTLLQDNKKKLYELDGLIFTGGDDFSLQKLGLEVDEEIIRKNNLIIDKERDDMEWDLATDFLKLKKPILGICRGMQLMNLVLGGSIYLDITEQHASCESHTSISDLISRKHKIYLNKESILSRSLGVTEGTVNSRHHQAVNKVARTLKIGAKSPDGIIEALEDESGRILLVQWHPELLYEEDRTTSFGLDILKLFINQVIISRSN